MSKKQISEELINVLAVALRHKIGSMVNPNAIYAERYAKDSDIFFKQAEKVKEQANWNSSDKEEIKTTLKRRLRNELEKKPFLPDKKYDYIDEEINKALRILDLN